MFFSDVRRIFAATGVELLQWPRVPAVGEVVSKIESTFGVPVTLCTREVGCGAAHPGACGFMTSVMPENLKSVMPDFRFLWLQGR